jgi:hypothetical protein
VERRAGESGDDCIVFVRGNNVFHILKNNDTVQVQKINKNKKINK